MLSDKKGLRRQLIQYRQNMPIQEKKLADERLIQNILKYVTKQRFKTIGVYLPIRGEPDLMELYQKLSSSYALSLPITPEKDAPLEFLAWQPGDSLVEGDYHILVPEVKKKVDAPQLLLIPCVGYTKDKYRLGYGGGYFDRTLAKYPNIHAVGIAYDKQETQFTKDENDLSLNCVITDQKIML